MRIQLSTLRGKGFSFYFIPYICYNKGTSFQMKEIIMEYTIKLTWDSEARVWIATSDDIDGLVLESGSFDALIERVRYTIPELLELNNNNNNYNKSANLHFLSERYEKVAL